MSHDPGGSRPVSGVPPSRGRVVWLRMRPIHVTASVIALTLLLGACSDDSNNTPDDSGPTLDGAVDAPTCTEGGACCTVGVDCPDQGPVPDAKPEASFCGVLEDEAGTIISGGDVLVCDVHTCRTDTTASDGSFCIFVADAGDYVFHATEREAGGEHYGDMLFPVTLGASEAAAAAKIDLGKVAVPLMGPAVKLDPQGGGTLDLGGGATLVVAAGATVLPPLKTEAQVAFRALDKAALHPRLLAAVPAGKSLEAAAVLVPVGVSFGAPATFELPLATGLAADTALEVYRINDEDGAVELKGQAKVSASDTLVNPSGGGLDALGLLLFVK